MKRFILLRDNRIIDMMNLKEIPNFSNSDIVKESEIIFDLLEVGDIIMDEFGLEINVTEEHIKPKQWQGEHLDRIMRKIFKPNPNKKGDYMLAWERGKYDNPMIYHRKVKW